MSNSFDDLMGDIEVRTDPLPVSPQQAYNPAIQPQPKAPEGMSFMQKWSTARELDSTVAAAGRLMGEPKYEPVEGYTVEEMPELLSDVPKQYHTQLAEYLYDKSVSPTHSQFLKGKFMHEMDLENKLAAEGWGGLGVRLAVNILDEGAIALGLATGGAGAALGWGAKAGRLVNAARLAGVAGGENMLLEAFLNEASATRTTGDILIAGLGGAVIGGALGAAFKPGRALKTVDGNAGRARKTIDAISDAEVRDAGGLPRPKVDDNSAVRKIELEETPRREVETEAHAKALERKTAAQKQAIADRRSEIAARVVELRQAAPEQPLKPNVIEKAPALRAELEELRGAVRDAKNPAQRTKADQKLQQFKRRVAAESGDFTTKNPSVDELEGYIKRLEKQVDAALTKYEKDLAGYNKTVDKVDAELTALKEEETKLSMSLGEGDKSAGSAMVRGKDVELTDTELMDEIYSYEAANPTPDTWGNIKILGIPLRPSVYAAVQRSDNRILKRLGNLLMEDGVGKKGDGVTMMTATEITDSDMMKYQYHFMKAARRDFINWKKAEGISKWNNSDKVRSKFYEAVSDAVESGAGHPDVQASAKAFSEVTQHVHAKARAAGLEGFDQFEARADYLPHQHRFEKITEFSATHTNPRGSELGPFEDLLFRSFREAGSEIDDEMLTRVVKSYSKTVRTIAAGDGMPMRFANLPNHTEEAMVISLREAGVDDDAIEAIVRDLRRNEEMKGRVKHAKHRAMLDMETAAEYHNEATGELETITLKDFFERDASLLMQGYVNNVNGWATLADMTKGTPYKLQNMNDLERLLDLAAREGAEMGQDAQKIATYQRMIRQAVNRSLGRSIIDDPNGFLGKVTRYTTDYTFTTSMGQVMWAQTAEWGNVVGQNSWKHLMREIPGLKQFVKGAGTTEFDKVFNQEIKDFWAFGTDNIRHQISHRYDVDTGGGMNVAKTRYDGAMEKVKGAVATPMHWMMDVQHRISMGAGMRNWVDSAFGKNMSKADVARLRDYGIDDAMAGRIRDQIRAHATDVEGNPLRNADQVHRVNFESWDDVDAANALKYGMARRERRIIQENTFGTSWDIANNKFGRVAFQFRGFIMNAYEKMLLHGIKHHDAQTYASFMASMFFAGASYVGMVHTRSMGMSKKDRKAYLEKRLTTEKIASAAFGRSGFASILPAFYDTAAIAAGFDPQFDVRTTGYSQSLASGIPAVAAADKLVNIQQALVGLAHGEDWSSSDWYQLKSLIPMNNLIGVQNIMNLIGQ